MSKTLLIVAHTPSPNTQSLLDAVVHGASDEAIESVCVEVSRPLQTVAQQVLQADGLILGTTENFGYMSGAMKDFFDRIYYPCLEHTQGLPYGLFVRAGNDGAGARTSIERIVSGLRWRQVVDPVIAAKSFSPRFVNQCEELGLTLAAGLDAGVF